jgi:hypothetical protein
MSALLCGVDVSLIEDRVRFGHPTRTSWLCWHVDEGLPPCGTNSVINPVAASPVRKGAAIEPQSELRRLLNLWEQSLKTLVIRRCPREFDLHPSHFSICDIALRRPTTAASGKRRMHY